VKPHGIRVEISEKISDFLGKLGDGTGACSVRKRKVDPEIAQDLGEVGFPTSIEAADPGRLLLGALEAIAITLEDAAHTVEVFALAYE
jgi:hypothetical protein